MKHTLLLLTILLATSSCGKIHETIARVPAEDIERTIDSACRMVELATFVTDRVAVARQMCAARSQHSLSDILDAVSSCDLKPIK